MARLPKQRGFTLVELVVIIVLIGIVAVTALPRLNTRDFDEVGMRDGVKAALQHARKTAVASRRFVCVNVGSSSVTVSRDNSAPDGATTINCNNPLPLPAPGKGCATNEVCTKTPGIALSLSSGTGVIFDPLGRPVSAPRVALTDNLTLTVATGVTITIHAESGAVQ